MILFLVTTFSLFAQNNLTPALNNNWTLGLNFSTYTFQSENNINSLLFSLERKINDQFFISLNTGISSHKPNNGYMLSSWNLSQNGNTTTTMVSTESEPLTGIPLHLSLKDKPFNWDLAPYLAVGYGVEYYFDYNSTAITKTNTRSANGNLLSEDERTTTQKNKGAFTSGGHYSIGVTYKINSNLYLDANVMFTGFDPAYISFGIKYGF